jgi:hypothetical protein
MCPPPRSCWPGSSRSPLRRTRLLQGPALTGVRFSRVVLCDSVDHRCGVPSAQPVRECGLPRRLCYLQRPGRIPLPAGSRHQRPDRPSLAPLRSRHRRRLMRRNHRRRRSHPDRLSQARIRHPNPCQSATQPGAPASCRPAVLRRFPPARRRTPGSQIVQG